MTDMMVQGALLESPFDAIRRVRADGTEYWSARELMPLLGYGSDWRNFVAAINRAKLAAVNAGATVSTLFGGVTENSGGRPREDLHLARYACYLVSLNGDPRKPEVAAAQTYFAVRTREAEVAPSHPMGRDELIARALLESQAIIAEREADIARLKAPARAWRQLAAAEGDMPVGEPAKVLARDHNIAIGQNRLFKALEAWGWAFKREGSWQPNQRAVEAGVLCLRSRTWTDREDVEHIDSQLRVTAKGLGRIHERLVAEREAS